MRGLRPFLAGSWQLAKPYFWRSDERWSALGLLAAILGLRFGLVGMSVVLSYWNRDFFEEVRILDSNAAQTHRLRACKGS